MGREQRMNEIGDSAKIMIGVGLRNSHIEDALSCPAPIDFVEVHAENYFAEGGALHRIIGDIAEAYPVSLHATALGLGSATAIPQHYLHKLSALTQLVKPLLISDHAAFSWGEIAGETVHGGDLLPLIYNRDSLAIMIERVDQVQQLLGRQILVENLSMYLRFPGSTMSEPEFLAELAKTTGCGLLIDLNNILVNAFNDLAINSLEAGIEWLKLIPKEHVGEIHLAGFSLPRPGQLAVDDHAQPVSEDGWLLYAHAVREFGSIPTLIEWDNQLPDWNTLVKQAQRARDIAQQVLRDE